MKKLFVSLALFSVTVGAFAAGGSINFQNRGNAVGKGAIIYSESSVDPTAVAQGNAADYANRAKLDSATPGHKYVAGLFIQNKDGNWDLISPLATFRTGGDAGLWTAPVTKVTAEGYASDSLVNLQVRAWDSTKAATWADVLKDGTVARGESKVISNYKVGAGDGTQSTTVQATLLAAGLESFGLYTVVPEPSVIALGALGLGALLLRRRK